LPSFRAASIKAGVTTVGSGAAARVGDAKALTVAIPEALRSVRLEIFRSGIAILSLLCVPRCDAALL
jgi:hypothetical protein